VGILLILSGKAKCAELFAVPVIRRLIWIIIKRYLISGLMRYEKTLDENRGNKKRRRRFQFGIPLSLTFQAICLARGSGRKIFGWENDN
jgi:hypothetical protein